MADLIYLYGVVSVNEIEQVPLPHMKGIDDDYEIQTTVVDGLAAVICHLDPHEFSEDVIKDKITNDMEWLQKKAFHHHETLLALQKSYTVIPMKFCTIYASENNLTKIIKEHAAVFKESLFLLKNNEEWNLKIYCDDATLKEHVIRHNSKIDMREIEISQLPPGKQFFERKKMEKMIETELENEKNALCEQLHDELKQFSIRDTVKKNWSKDVTGRKDEMSWNSVYLLPDEQVNDFLDKVQLLNEKLSDEGWRFEASGPWPPYHFATIT